MGKPKLVQPDPAVHADGTTYNVNPDLLPLLREISWVTKDPENARHHPDRSIIDIAKSYQDFGQQKPIVVYPDGKLIAGEGQWIAARDRLGWTHIAAVVFNVGRPLTPEELAAVAEQFGLADNRSAEQSEWDYEALGQKMKRLTDAGIDLADLGWLPHEAATIMSADWDPPAIEDLNKNHGEVHALKFTDSQWRVVERVVSKVQKVKGEEMEPGDAVIVALHAYLGPRERKKADA